MKTMSHSPSHLSFLPVLALALAGCAGFRAAHDARGVTLLAINDVYRIEGVDGGAEGGLARVRALRAELERRHPDLIVLHAGDLLFPSLPSRLYQGEQMIDVLNLLDGDPEGFDERFFVTFGNHEFDKAGRDDAAMVDRRVEESQFRWLASNIRWTAGDDDAPLIAAGHLVDTVLVDAGGARVGLFSLTTDEKHPDYVERFLPPAEVARERVARLRSAGADVVVALTHLRFDQDLELLRTLGRDGPDLVVGGHEHNKIHDRARRRWVLKADAEARSATVIRVVPRRRRPPQVRFEYRELDAAAPADPAVGERVAAWLARLDREYCASIERDTGCLDDVVGRTRVRLKAEELEIRRFETNLGNWVADQARLAFAGEGAAVAFLNSGTLRLNQDIPPGDVTLEHVEETFQYPSELVLLRLTGRLLQEVASHAVTEWTGNGKWLQVSGFAFRHDPATETAGDLTLLTPEGPRPIAPDDEILAVAPGFIADGGDGYEMLKAAPRLAAGASPTLRELAIRGLEAAGGDGIAPEVEGRICNAERPGPCLVSPAGS